MKCLLLLSTFVLSAYGGGGGDTNVLNTKEKYGEKAYGLYTVRNDVWGPDAGEQSLVAQSASSWTVTCNHGSSGGIKSYPHTGYWVNRTLEKVKGLKSSYSVSVDCSGGKLAYAVTYDIWLQHHKYEIMIWVNYVGEVGPIGSMVKDNVAIGGATYAVHKGSNKANDVFSFLTKNKSNSGSVDLSAVMAWINTQNWFAEKLGVLVDEVQFGFEITSTPSNSKFIVKSFSVSEDK